MWWIIRSATVNVFRAGLFIIGQSRQAFFSRSEAPSECFCGQLHRLPRDLTLQPHLAPVALKRKPTARGTRAPRALSIVGSFFSLPWQGSVADSVVPDGCHLVLEAARALPAAIREAAQNDSTRATTPIGRAGVEIAAPSPRCDEPARLFRVGWSDSPAQYRRCSAVPRGLNSVRRL